MAPQASPQCTALAAAKARTNLSYAQIGQRIGQSEQHVIDICTGVTQPTKDEFDALAGALGISGPPPSDSHHKV